MKDLDVLEPHVLQEIVGDIFSDALHKHLFHVFRCEKCGRHFIQQDKEDWGYLAGFKPDGTTLE